MTLLLTWGVADDGEQRLRERALVAVRSLGRRSGPGRAEAVRRCPPGALLLYTDGLTDVAGEGADKRDALLERTPTELPPGAAANDVVARVLEACRPPQLRDDVALLAVRFDR